MTNAARSSRRDNLSDRPSDWPLPPSWMAEDFDLFGIVFALHRINVEPELYAQELRDFFRPYRAAPA